MNEVVTFEVVGVPAPAGSKSIGRRRDGTPFVRHYGAEKQRPWRANVAAAAAEAMGGRALLDGPLQLDAIFFRPRPRGHFARKGLSAEGQRAPYPATRPDLTKLVRGVEDALLGVAFREDSQVVVQRTMKFWGEPARALISLRTLQ